MPEERNLSCRNNNLDRHLVHKAHDYFTMIGKSR